MSMTLYYTFGVGTPDAMRGALAKLDKSDYLACIIPPYKFVKKATAGTEEEMKALLANPQLVVIGGETEEQVLACMQQRIQMLVHLDACEYMDMGNEFMPEFKPEEFRAVVEDQLLRFVSMSVMLFNTAQQSVKNYFLNAYETFVHQDWAGTARSIVRPLVVVGMGPSMAGEIDTLRALHGRVHILAVDNALRYLMRHGITPDLVAQVEWSSRSMDFYKDCGLTEKNAPTLIALAGVYPDVVQTWPGPVLTFCNHQMAIAFGGFTGNHTPRFFGSNVGTFAFQVADVLAPPEVWMVGFDFGSPCYLYFHPGSVNMEGEFYPTMTRHWSPLKGDYLYNRRQQESVEVKDRGGNTMLTATSFESDRRLIETMVSQSKIPYYNTSKHGREIAGVKYRPLAELRASVSVETVPIACAGKVEIDNGALADTCRALTQQLHRYQYLQTEVFRTAVDGMTLIERGQTPAEALRAFDTAVSALQGEPVVMWIEAFMATLEPELRHVFVAGIVRSRDFEKKSERLQHFASLVRDFYPNTEKFIRFLEEFLEMLRRKAEVAR